MVTCKNCRCFDDPMSPGCKVGTDDVYSIEIDLSADILEEPEMKLKFEKYLKANGIKMKIIEEHGPAGGNPVVEYTGTDNALRKMLSDPNTDDIYFYDKDRKLVKKAD